MSSEEAAGTSEELTFDEVDLESARFEKLLPTAWFEGFW